MFLGSSAVFAMVYAMNAASPPPPQPAEKTDTAFQVERKPPPPKPKEPRTERKRTQTSAPRSAPTPNLASAIAGVSFNLPSFETADFAQVSDNLLGSASRHQVFTADAVDEKPKALSRVEPAFPERARQRGISGHVKLNLLINTSGEVEKAKVLEAQPQGVFEEPALAAVQKWRFDPPRYQGEPVKMWFQQTVRFELN
jgi:protein TonB